MFKRFQLEDYQTTVKQEVLAGLVTFFSISYILFVNPMILQEAGVPSHYSIYATIFISIIGSFCMGWFANAPLVMAPGMGENTFFTFTLVGAIGLSWQQSLAVVVIAGFLFTLLAFLGIMKLFRESIPAGLKVAITSGIGFFLIIIGLENMGIIVDGGLEWNTLSIVGLLLLVGLKKKAVKGAFLITILFTTVLYWGMTYTAFEPVSFEMSHLFHYGELVRSVDFSQLFSIEFALGVFSLTMLLMFETIGMVEAFLKDAKRIEPSYKVGAVTGMLSGFLGTSPAIPVAENGAGMEEGGRTGLTAITSSILFLLALFIAPFLSYIPSEAVGPVIVATGVSMSLAGTTIRVTHTLEWLPILLIIVLIPVTGSIVDGMAYGFILYPFIQLIIGKKERLNRIQWIISGLFFLTLLSTWLFI
ncbi:NCS2 family permease [Alkalibacterium iburiense]|uniref:NCS2 family permease n=1 Tax=Alkalibacterium iburiense TaxID=290589 RepID=A0ABN0XDR5_9LACT